MINLVNSLKTGKCAYEGVLRNFRATTKCAGTRKVPRLFSLRKDPVIGTEIRNNMTGTRYLQRRGVNGREVNVEPLTTVHYADGSYSSIPNNQFNKLLEQLKLNPNSWNPVIKSDASIGQELFINNPAIAGRYFRPNTPANDLVTNNLITRITPNHYNTISLKDFDKMILNLLG